MNRFAMNRSVAASMLLLLGAGAASAADLRMPVKSPPLMQAPMSWTGFYLGGNVGGGWTNSSMEFSFGGGPAFATVDNNLSGILGGGQVGYNWQSGPAVFGVEADFQWTGMKGSLVAPCPPGICAGLAASFTQKMPWFGTARARIGYAGGGWMIYATGGYAYTRLESVASATAGGVAATLSRDDKRDGWTAGGGIEVMLAPNWSAKLEYLYLDFGNRDGSWTITGLPTLNDNTELRTNVVRTGVNYRF
jgi:outer membrane immunogenic protein